MRIAIVLAGLSLACSVSRDVVHVTLRDPAQLEVRALGQPIVAVGEPHGAIPERAFFVDARPDAYVERTGDELEVWCPHCGNIRRRRIIGGCVNAPLEQDRVVCHELAPPVLALEGKLADVVHTDGADVHLRYRYDDSERVGRHGTYEAPRLELELVTPRANVVSIEAVRPVQTVPDDRATGRAIAWIAAAMAIAGAGLIALDAAHEAHSEGPGVWLLVTGAVVSPAMWLESRVHQKYAAIPP